MVRVNRTKASSPKRAPSKPPSNLGTGPSTTKLSARHRLSKNLAAAILAIAMLGTTASCALFGLDNEGLFSIPLQTRQAFSIGLDLGDNPSAGSTAPERLQIPLGLPALPVSLSDLDDFAAQSDKLERLEIRAIKVTPNQNSATGDIPPLSIYVSQPGATSTDGGILIATVPSIPAGSREAVAGDIDDDGMEAAQPLLTGLDFALVPASLLVVEEGETVPSGAVDLEIAMTIHAVVDPTK